MIEVIVILLIVAIVLQHWFFMKQIQVLVDKVMSKNYAEFEQVRDFKQQPQQNGFSVSLKDTVEPFEDDLKTLNDLIR